MKYRCLDYSNALAAAKKSRPLIAPNIGFEHQLRIWKLCDYDVHLAQSTASATSVSLMPKPAYEFWRFHCEKVFQGPAPGSKEAIFAMIDSVAAELKKWEKMGEKNPLEMPKPTDA